MCDVLIFVFISACCVNFVSILFKHELHPSTFSLSHTLILTDQIAELQKRLDALLKEGVMTLDYVCDNIQVVMNVMRDSNVTIRWLMLHSHVDVRVTDQENRSAE
jgi:hypothetical protein